MALFNVCRNASLCRQLGRIQQVRHAGYWNRDWKPAPYPTTEEQRRAAAKKYNMIYEDYEPYPDDGDGYGDYPKLPIIHADRRDGFQHYDAPEFRRNFGEPLHIDFDDHQTNRPDPLKQYPSPEWHYWAWFFGPLLAYIGLYFLFEPYPTFRPAMDKQMPTPGPESHVYHPEYSPMILSFLPKNPGEVHYTFEPEDS